VAGWVLAIDFGTSFTSVALNENDRVELVEVDNVRAMPSGVWLDGSGSLIVGTSAERQARSAPERWERSPKRLLGEVAPLLLGGDKVIAVVEAVAAVLKHASEEACRRQGGPPDEVRLTYPARWGDRRRGALQAAAQIAGLGPPVVTRPPRLIPEPVAAALYFADRGALPAGSQVGVYDLGGGTFDSTVLGADAEGYTVRALGGLDNVGGESFDALLYAHVGKEIARRDESVWTSLQEPPDARWRRAGEDLYREVRRAKEDLSKYPSVTLDMAGLVGQPLQLTRDELESVLRPRIEATARELIETISRAGQRPADLAAVYLAGGSSRMPLVERIVSDTLGATAKVLGEPKSVVAIGAAKWSADVRVDIKPQQPARGRPTEPNAILPTVPAAQSTKIISPPPPARTMPPAPTPPPSRTAPQAPAPQSPPPSRPLAPTGSQPRQSYQPQQWQPPPYHPPPPTQQPPPRPGPPPGRHGQRRGVVIGAVALALTCIVAAVVIVLLIDTSTPPTPPTNLRATETEDAVNLDWDAVSGADHYSVYRDDTVIAADVSRTTYVDRPGNSKDHVYAVTAFDSDGTESKRSSSLTASTNPDSIPGHNDPVTPSLTAAQQALVDRLPLAAVDPDTCEAFTALEDAATDAAVRCDPATRSSSAAGTAPAAVFAGHDRTRSLYDEDLAEFSKDLGLAKRSCGTPPAESAWTLKSDPNRSIGKLFCYTSTLNKAVLQWNYDADLIWIQAVADDSANPALLAWWKDLNSVVLR